MKAFKHRIITVFSLIGLSFYTTLVWAASAPIYIEFNMPQLTNSNFAISNVTSNPLGVCPTGYSQITLNSTIAEPGSAGGAYPNLNFLGSINWTSVSPSDTCQNVSIAQMQAAVLSTVTISGTGLIATYIATNSSNERVPIQLNGSLSSGWPTSFNYQGVVYTYDTCSLATDGSKQLGCDYNPPS